VKALPPLVCARMSGSLANSLPLVVDQALRSLQPKVAEWYALRDAERATVARLCRAQLATLDMSWAEENARCVGIEPSRRDAYNTLGMDPFLFVAVTAERLDKIADVLEGKVKVGEGVISEGRQAPGDLKVYSVGPVAANGAPGCDLELWAEATVADTVAEEMEHRGAGKGVSLVLGAGNQNFLTSVDVIERIFMHKECVLLKHHPIRAFLAAPLQHVFQPLADRGAYAQVLDSDIAGAHSELITHPLVSHIHMTGSGSTHDRIVAALSSANRLDAVGFSSELGCVSPWIICPGVSNSGIWTDVEIEHHATMLAGAFKSSCSMNCLSPKVLVLPSEALWPQRVQFLEALRTKLASMPQLPPYYPGAHDRFTAFRREYSDAEVIEAPPAQKLGDGLEEAVHGELGQSLLPLPSLLVDVGTLDAACARPYAIKNEAFAPVLAIATVESDSFDYFPMAAARAVNEHVFGSLSCTLIYPDERDSRLDAVLWKLKYGCVAVNMWAALAYANPLNVWGAAPGTYNVSQSQSGLGFVGNVAGVPNVSKGVALSPFVNPKIAGDKPIPFVVLDALLPVVSGKSFAGARALGSVVSRGFGLIPRKMPKDTRKPSEVRDVKRCF